MNGRSRTERKELARAQRRESLRDGSYFLPSRKKCRNRSLTLSLAMVLFIFALLGGMKALGFFDIFSFSDELSPEEAMKTLFFNEEVMVREYQKIVHDYASVFEEDKRLRDVIYPSETEISLKQVSTDVTKSLISAYLKEDRITKVAVVGLYDPNNNRFAMGFKENMILVSALALRVSPDEAEKLLEINGMFSEKDLFLKPSIFEYEGKEFVFHIADQNNFYFSISKKQPLVSR